MKRHITLRWVLLAITVFLTVPIGTGIFVYFHLRPGPAKDQARQPLAAAAVADAVPEPNSPEMAADAGDFSSSNSVTCLLGEDDSGHGLVHNDSQGDGLTTIESMLDVPARVARLTGNRTEVYFYFKIHPTFKKQDLRRVRMEVEYFAPGPGTMNIHYDALSGPNAQSAAYRTAVATVRLSNSGRWEKATFHTRNDVSFRNRQNGGSDFRIFAKTPVLYVRRVTVTQEPVVEDAWPGDFSTSNQVSITLGEEKSQDGLQHLPEERDGLTTIVNLEGVTCRQLDLAAKGKPFGSFYFTIAPSFKRTGLTNALIEVEYLAKRSNSFRVQFDGMQGGTSHSYVTVVPIGAQLVRRYGEFSHALTPTLGTWSVASFHITNATFRNSQNGGADFRFEVIPPAMYVRRVTVSRENP